MKGKRYLFLVAIIFLMALGFVIFSGIKVRFEFPGKSNALEERDKKRTEDRRYHKKGGLPDFSSIYEELKPAVVYISTVRKVKNPFYRFKKRHGGKERDKEYSPFYSPFDFWEDLFKWYGIPEEIPQGGLGSGFIIDKNEGLILTNNHVVENADEITVKLYNDKKFNGKVIGRDKNSEVALIRIEGAKELVEATLGNSDDIKVGDWVVAIGNPFGLDYTLTAGIISARGRVIGVGPLDDMLQTDASINPGNSGGPLINMDGEVIGINTAIQVGGQGIGFAIPINLALKVIPSLKEKGHFIRGFLGVYFQSLTDELREEFNLKEGLTGVVVTEVIKDSPADRGGIKRGDIIYEFEGNKIVSQYDLVKFVGLTPPGKTVKLKIIRNNREKVVKVKLGQREEDVEASLSSKIGKETYLGLSVTTITKDVKDRYDLDIDTGVLVDNVEPGSLASDAGVMEGDIILEVNHQRVKTEEDFFNALEKGKKKGRVLLLIKREEGALFVVLPLE